MTGKQFNVECNKLTKVNNIEVVNLMVTYKDIRLERFLKNQPLVD